MRKRISGMSYTCIRLQSTDLASDVKLTERPSFPMARNSSARSGCESRLTTSENRRIPKGARSCTSGGVHFLWRPSLAHLWPGKSWPSFVNYVEGCFRSSAETIEPGRGHYLPNASLAGLGT